MRASNEHGQRLHINPEKSTPFKLLFALQGCSSLVCAGQILTASHSKGRYAQQEHDSTPRVRLERQW
jgi:hypothetical protein